MLDALPRRAFFRFEIPLHYQARALRMDGDLAKWKSKFRLPSLIELEADKSPFAEVYAAWNEDHFFVAFDVRQEGPLQCDPQQWWKKDGLRLCLDTRDARDNKRGTRFCHFFYLLPAGGGSNRKQPVVGLHRMSRAKESPPPADPAQILVGAHIERNRGYFLEAALPAACLNGWNPAEHPRIGLFYKVKSQLHGGQHLTVTDELGWNVDPSTWATGVLTR